LTKELLCSKNYKALIIFCLKNLKKGILDFEKAFINLLTFSGFDLETQKKKLKIFG
jgi:hypothetical protein